MNSILKNSICHGVVSSADPSNCTAKVYLKGPDKVSGDLPVLVQGSREVKQYWMPVPGEQVLCLFLPNGNTQGFILGSFYSEANTPVVGSKDKRQIAFQDGTVIEYDQETKTLKIDTPGEIKIQAEKISISAPQGVSITATDPDGSGVTIAGKDDSGSW